MPDYKSVMISSGNKKKKKKKQNIFVALISGLIPWKGDSKGEVIRKIIFLASIVLLCVTFIIIVDTYIFAPQRVKEEYKSNLLQLTYRDPTQQEIDALPEKTVNTEYAPMYGINKDFVGWLTIMNTNINYPVVQGKDNDEYLHKDFYGDDNFNGTVFADYENCFSATENMSGNTILYGHNLRTDNFFTEVTEYRRLNLEGSLEFLKQHPVIEFNTLYENAKYKIFAVMLLNTREEYGEVFGYQSIIDFNNRAEFEYFTSECLDRSEFFTGLDLRYGDEFLTLSTCEFEIGLSDMRIVVVSRKVREDENDFYTEEELERFCLNPEPKYCDSVRWVYGLGEWKGRYWDPAWIKDFKKDDTFLEMPAKEE